MARPGVAIALAVGLTLTAVGSAAASSERQPRIVGGDETTIAQWPWQVALAVNDEIEDGDGYDRQFCGGSLVAPTIVITAAHCVSGPGGFDDAGNFEVFTGRTTLSSNQGQAIDVAEVYYFVNAGGTPEAEAQSGPNEGPALDWDVAFLELEAASTSPPIKIAGADEGATWAPGRAAFVSGWGDTETQGFPDDLRAAQIEIIADSVCDSPAVYGPFFFPEIEVCAGFMEGGVDTCGGDSGGPLVVPIAGGGFRLVGDTIWGFGCAEPENPGVYGRIADDPIRSALEDGIADEAGGYDVTGSGAEPDTAAPRTTIDDAPKRKTRKRKARFEFSSSEGAPIFSPAFECKLDDARFEPCESPAKVRVRRGKHRFQVRAVDLSGNLDASPAKHAWKRKRKRGT